MQKVWFKKIFWRSFLCDAGDNDDTLYVYSKTFLTESKFSATTK